MDDPAIKAVYRAHAVELWGVLSRKVKTCITHGVVPAGVLMQEAGLGYDPEKLSRALLEIANGAR